MMDPAEEGNRVKDMHLPITPLFYIHVMGWRTQQVLNRGW